MKGNFTKDLYLIKRELIIAIFAEIFFIIIAALTRITGRDILPILKSDMALPLLLGAVLPPIILAETMMMDEKCDYMRYSLASPAGRIGYVAEKYLFVIIISVIMSGLSVVFLLVAERPLFKSADYFLDMNPLAFIFIVIFSNELCLSHCHIILLLLIYLSFLLLLILLHCQIFF